MAAMEKSARYALLLMLGLASGQTQAAAMSPAELADLARRTTFEVVLPKIEPEYIRYEKPLPLELLNFTERNDKYWSIGTAFAIAPDTYVSAAHVLLSGIGGPIGKPYLRDSTGNTYQIDQVLRFSLHEDFIVFRAKGAPARTPLAPNREPATGATVYAVGNALGDGVIVRDGLLTSMTPEDQDGRWKWLRFSAAASPGNSGGPLLDTEGRVAGVVVMKSAGENLNYALPIARVLDGSSSAATIDVRSSFALPILRQQLVTNYKQNFVLPASWESFSRTLIESNDRQYDSNQKQLLEQQDAQLLPRGQTARLLSTLDRDTHIGLMQQQEDDTWAISKAESEQETKLTDGGSLWTGSLPGTATFRLERPALSADSALYHNATTFMDTLLKGLRIPRVVGSQAIRITSLGAPQREELHKDRFGRVWQLRIWSMGFSDLNVIAMALPTPEGYSGLLRLSAAAGIQESINGLKLMTDHLHVSYQGSATQWRAFLAERDLCPPMLRGMELGKDKDFAMHLREMDIAVPAALFKLDDESPVAVHPGYRSDGRQLRAEPAGVTLSKRDSDSSWIGIFAQSKPASGAGKELDKRWTEMSSQTGDFTGLPQHSSDFKEFWTTSTVGKADSGLLYEVVLSWHENSLIPRQVGERRDRILSGLKATEPEAH